MRSALARPRKNSLNSVHTVSRSGVVVLLLSLFVAWCISVDKKSYVGERETSLSMPANEVTFLGLSHFYFLILASGRVRNRENENIFQTQKWSNLLLVMVDLKNLNWICHSPSSVSALCQLDTIWPSLSHIKHQKTQEQNNISLQMFLKNLSLF